MKPLLVWALLSTLSRPILAVSPAEEKQAEVVSQDGDKMTESAAVAAGDDEGVDYTIFNDIKVSPMKDIEGELFNETIKDGYW